MRNIKSKKGSHLDVILSFIMFVGFLIFLYVAVEPAIRTPVNEEYLLNNLKNVFIDYVSNEGGTGGYNLIINGDCSSSYFSNCFKINPSLNPQINAKITSPDGEHNYLNDISLIIECTTCKGRTYNILFSKDFPSGDPSIKCSKELPEICYTYTEYSPGKSISLSAITTLKNDYDNDEKVSLREKLNIPEKNWFWFKITDAERNSLIEPLIKPTILETENIYSQEIPINYIDDRESGENTIKDGFLVIQFW